MSIGTYISIVSLNVNELNAPTKDTDWLKLKVSQLCPTLCDSMDYTVHGSQRVLYRIKRRRNMPRHILIKLTKTKHKERILKAAREKQQVTYKGNPIRLTADLSPETLKARR